LRLPVSLRSCEVVGKMEKHTKHTMNRSVVQAFLLVVLLITNSYATETMQERADSMRDIIKQSGTAYIAVVISFLLAALLYMASSFFSDARLLAFSKEAFYQSIVSLILIASFPVIYLVVSQLVLAAFMGNLPLSTQTDVYDISEMFLIWNYIYYIVHILIITILYSGIAGIINQQYSIPIAGSLVTVNLMAFAKPLLFAMNMGISLLTTSLFINGFQLLFLNLVHYALLPVFLPLGILLRVFPGTMNAGNVLLALAIGAYIITPLVYVFDIYLITEILSDKHLQPKSSTNTIDYKNSLGLMPFFYNNNTLLNAVVSKKCPLLNTVADKITGTSSYMILMKDYTEYNMSLDGCGVVLDAIPTSISTLPTWAKVAFGTAGAATVTAALAKIATTAKSLSPDKWNRICQKRFLSTFCKYGSWTVFGLGAFSALSTGVVAITLFALSFDLIAGTAASFIILSVILPFLNFTIIIIFIRDFSQFVLGTPISLGHVARLI